MYYQKQDLLTLREHFGSPPVFGGDRVAHIFICFVLGFFYVSLRHVTNIATVSGLSISDYPSAVF